MTRGLQKRGWCPSLYAPMESGDGLLVRVKPPYARLTPTQARALATAATRFGNGTIELTQRGNLQIRGLSHATTAPFAAAMIEAGLAHPDPAQESRRAVIPAALLGDDPTIHPGAAALTAALEHAFATHEALANLPAKFAVAIDAGGILANRPIAADLIATADGTIDRPTPGKTPPLVGPLPYPGTNHAAYGLAPPFSQMTADLLRQAADLAEHHATTLRITPWRTILLGRIPVHALIDAPAWITDPADPRLLITACPGSPACAATEAPARTVAIHLRPSAPLHLSGCAKGCAHPGPAALTLVGCAGRYDLVHNGRASDPPTHRNLTLEQAAALI